MGAAVPREEELSPEGRSQGFCPQRGASRLRKLGRRAPVGRGSEAGARRLPGPRRLGTPLPAALTALTLEVGEGREVSGLHRPPYPLWGSLPHWPRGPFPAPRDVLLSPSVPASSPAPDFISEPVWE